MPSAFGINAALNNRIYDVEKWDGIMSSKVKLTAKDDGEDRQSSYADFSASEGKSFIDIDAIKKRKERNDNLKQEYKNLVLNSVISNEVSLIEFFERDIYTGGEVRVHYAQLGMILDPKAIIYSGRATGKTWTIKWNGVHRAVNFPGSQIIVWSHDDAHVKPRAEEIFKLVDKHEFFTRLLAPRSLSPRSKRAPYRQDFENGFVWHGVYPGLEGKQLEKFHVDGAICDESQELEDIHIEKWEPTQNAFQESRGSIRKFFGVNTQGKTDTPFYRMTFRDQTYEGHVYVIPSWNNPREYTYEKHVDYLKTYGGNVGSPKFKQMIRGKLGDKSAGVFNSRHYDNCADIRYRIGRELGLDDPIPYRKISIYAQDIEARKRNFRELIPAPLAVPCTVDVRIGMDFGFGAAPTAIEIYFLICNCKSYDCKHEKGIWHLGESIQLFRVEEDVQAEFVHYLINREGPNSYLGYGGLYPDVSYMGVDTTANTNIYGYLTAKNDIRFNNPVNEYSRRLVPVSFSDKIIATKVLDEPPDGIRKKKSTLPDGSVVWSIMQDIVPFSTNLIAQRMADNGYSLPSIYDDGERRGEFLNLSFDGKKYSAPGGKDHIIAANRCFEVVMHLKDTIDAIDTELLRSLLNYEEQSGGYTIFVDWGGYKNAYQ